MDPLNKSNNIGFQGVNLSDFTSGLQGDKGISPEKNKATFAGLDSKVAGLRKGGVQQGGIEA